MVVGVGSGKVRALVLDDFLKYIMQDGLGVVGIFHVLRDSQDVTAFADVVLDIVIRALIRELGHFDFLRSKLLV